MPPSRVRYSAYYHVFTTICKNDQPSVFGKVNRRTDTKDTANPSPFESYKVDKQTGNFEAVSAIDRLIENLSCRNAILSYSSGGRATATELTEVLEKHGEILEVQKIDHQKNVMAGMRWTNDWIPSEDENNQEFLFLLRLAR
jgi:adenine-specific DNA-methyltransferase